jgi:Fe-S cluster assembly iron-binding protein IscA
MVTVTDRARARLVQLKTSAHVDEPEVGLRLELEPTVEGDFVLCPDRPVVGDHVVEDAGEKILLIDAALARVLANATIDYESTDSGVHLIVKH